MNNTSKKIVQDFKDLAAANPKLKSLFAKLYSADATYLDADRYALELATTLGKALQLNLGGEKLTGEAYHEVVSEALPPSLYRIYDEVADYAQTVQKGINDRMGVRLNAVKPDFNAKEAGAITKKAASVGSYDKIPGGLTNDMQHMAQNVATDTMKANAKLANDVGYQATVTRIYDRVGVHTQNGGKYRKECRWCLERCGVDVPYPDAIANDMFRRHPGCGCEIRYTVKGRTQVQTDWRKNQWTDSVPIKQRTPYDKNWQDVAVEYRKKATPGQPPFFLENGFVIRKDNDEGPFAEWINQVFGGDLLVLKKSEEEGVLSPDYLWNGRLWDLKTLKSSKKSTIEKRIRHGFKQIEPNPGGLMLDFGKSELTIDDTEDMVRRIIKNAAHWDVDIIIKKDKEFKIIRAIKE